MISRNLFAVFILGLCLVYPSYGLDPLELTLEEDVGFHATAWAILNERELRLVLKNGTIRDYSLPELNLLRSTRIAVQGEGHPNMPLVAISKDGQFVFESGVTSSTDSFTWQIVCRGENFEAVQLARFANLSLDLQGATAAFSPQNDLLAITTRRSSEHGTALWNPRTGRVVRDLDVGENSTGYTPLIEFNPRGDRLLRSTHVQNSLREWRTSDGRIMQDVPRELFRGSMTVAGYFPVNSFIVGTDLNENNSVFSFSGGEATDLYPSVCQVYSLISWTLDGRVGFCTHRDSTNANNKTSVFEAGTGSVLKELKGTFHWPYRPYLSAARWLLLADKTSEHTVHHSGYYFLPRKLLLYDRTQLFAEGVPTQNNLDSLNRSLAAFRLSASPAERAIAFEHLVRSPQTVELLAGAMIPEREEARLRPAALRDLVRLLDDDLYRVRARAHSRLVEMIEGLTQTSQAVQFLNSLQTLKAEQGRGRESIRRIDYLELLIPRSKLALPLVSSDNQLRLVSHFQVLSRIASPESRSLLETLRNESLPGSETRVLAEWALSRQGQ